MRCCTPPLCAPKKTALGTRPEGMFAPRQLWETPMIARALACLLLPQWCACAEHLWAIILMKALRASPCLFIHFCSSGNDKRPGSRGFKKLSEFGSSSLQGYKNSQNTCWIVFQCSQRGEDDPWPIFADFLNPWLPGLLSFPECFCSDVLLLFVNHIMLPNWALSPSTAITPCSPAVGVSSWASPWSSFSLSSLEPHGSSAGVGRCFACPPEVKKLVRFCPA